MDRRWSAGARNRLNCPLSARGECGRFCCEESLAGFVAQLRIFQELVTDEIGWCAVLQVAQTKVRRVHTLTRLQTDHLVQLAAKYNAAAGQHPDGRMPFHRGCSSAPLS